ncbi:MAG: N-acetylmuramoyl-L-alanine amidase [Candidatus Zixiibacteriota bacterium]
MKKQVTFTIVCALFLVATLVFAAVGYPFVSVLHDAEGSDIDAPNMQNMEFIRGNQLPSILQAEIGGDQSSKSAVLHPDEHQILSNHSSVVSFTHELKADPDRIQVSTGHSSSLADTAESSSSELSNELKDPLNKPIDIIVIDPGHGGEDSGAVGSNGLVEKEVTLDMALRLESLLQKEKGVRIILTRDKDELVPLEERAKIANQKGADLFISIHTNASKKKDAQGFEVFFLSAAKNDEARAVAALENSAIRFERADTLSQNRGDLDFILMDLVQSEFLLESSDLAAAIRKHLKTELDIPDRGVNQAGFRVLNQAYMPAVLVEAGFISNRQEEALLKKSSFREKIARAIYESIREFKKKYEPAQ